MVAFSLFLVRAFSEAPPPNRQLASAQRPPLDSADSGRVRPPPSRQLAVAFSADSAPLVLSKRRRSLRLVLWERPQPRRSVRPQQVRVGLGYTYYFVLFFWRIPRVVEKEICDTNPLVVVVRRGKNVEISMKV